MAVILEFYYNSLYLRITNLLWTIEKDKELFRFLSWWWMV